jgi:hypothetical protein
MCHSAGDTKVTFTLVGSVSVDGKKLQLVLLAKGKATICHSQFGAQDQKHDRHRIWYSPSTWPREVALDRFETRSTSTVSETGEVLGIQMRRCTAS